MAKISGRITIVCADNIEYNTISANALTDVNASLVSEDPQTFTIIVDLLGN